MEIRNSQAQRQTTLSQTAASGPHEQVGNTVTGQTQTTIPAVQDNLSLSADAWQLAQASGKQAMAEAAPIADQQQAQTVLGKIVSQLSVNPQAAQTVYKNLKVLNFQSLFG